MVVFSEDVGRVLMNRIVNVTFMCVLVGVMMATKFAKSSIVLSVIYVSAVVIMM